VSKPTLVIDYGAGNLRSAAKALAAAGAENVVVSGDPADVARAGRIVLPGVGAFAQCIGALRGVAGLEAALERAVRGAGVPFLGICVGMQLLATEGREHGVHHGLGWIDGSVARLEPGDLKVPHMGWNEVHVARPHPVLAALQQDTAAYYVHSYHFTPADPANLLATSDYGGPITAAIGQDNMLGVQFHPEKSQRYGLAFLESFLAWHP
jgi:imidazole glycerol-phosphate synthase subunit HisH